MEPVALCKKGLAQLTVGTGDWGASTQRLRKNRGEAARLLDDTVKPFKDPVEALAEIVLGERGRESPVALQLLQAQRKVEDSIEDEFGLAGSLILRKACKAW